MLGRGDRSTSGEMEDTRTDRQMYGTEGQRTKARSLLLLLPQEGWLFLLLQIVAA